MPTLGQRRNASWDMMFEWEYVGDFMHAFILLPEWFYMYIPAYVLSQAWLNKTVETELKLYDITCDTQTKQYSYICDIFRLINVQ